MDLSVDGTVIYLNTFRIGNKLSSTLRVLKFADLLHPLLHCKNIIHLKSSSKKKYFKCILPSAYNKLQ